MVTEMANVGKIPGGQPTPGIFPRFCL